MPSPGAQIGLRAAYALARRNGLTRADHVSLSLSTKDPKAPLVLWTFQGKHTQQDSQAIHIDALTGALVDEDRMNDLTRAERDTQLQKGLEALQSLFRPRSADDSKVETFYTLLSKRPASENVLFVLATEPPRRLLSTSFPSFQLC